MRKAKADRQMAWDGRRLFRHAGHLLAAAGLPGRECPKVEGCISHPIQEGLPGPPRIKLRGAIAGPRLTRLGPV